jgi:hypothetical protein
MGDALWLAVHPLDAGGGGDGWMEAVQFKGPRVAAQVQNLRSDSASWLVEGRGYVMLEYSS